MECCSVCNEKRATTKSTSGWPICQSCKEKIEAGATREILMSCLTISISDLFEARGYDSR